MRTFFADWTIGELGCQANLLHDTMSGSSSQTRRFGSGAGSSGRDYFGDTWFLDEVFVMINGRRQYLRRAVDQDGDVIDFLVQPRRDGSAARRFFRCRRPK